MLANLVSFKLDETISIVLLEFVYDASFDNLCKILFY